MHFKITLPDGQVLEISRSKGEDKHEEEKTVIAIFAAVAGFMAVMAKIFLMLK